ncbi:AraC family transcriptional regulator [Oscillibacter sp. MSJ-2]|uniref:AraC family transcriptional regulator n=1 Tax=Dysosmobacter acutus TaxID=2841504 RepID=A0ABS6FD99_9FIRM|nr:AraC family transcriptional regulator [Dysosmobacter acutus]MBU5628251.1 AraC family transcriptional regulator [Dysosmobacter acutus]
MDWITGIQRALDYTEAHLTEKIDYTAVARQACSSTFHFQRMFTMLCGFSLGDYIRMRRLSLSAEELTRTGGKVVDIALKYGYDTPESFSRAFTRFHGISPTDARRGGTVKSFSRLSVKLILSGGSTMDYRIEKKEPFQLICKKKQVTKPQGETAAADISPFWAQCQTDGTIEELCRCGRFDTFGGILGVCFSSEMAESGFPYGIGAEYGGVPSSAKGLDILDIPAHTYAVFQCRGRMPDAFTEAYRRICTEFFPQSNYVYGNGVELEVYPSAEVQDPNYTCEIWIAVNEKEQR